MKRKSSIATLLILGTLPLAAVCADQMQPPRTHLAASSAPGYRPGRAGEEAMPPMFKKLDMNHDSYLTKDEAKASVEVSSKFSSLDADNDGKISVSEFSKGMQMKQ
jgi:hypothetical protein